MEWLTNSYGPRTAHEARASAGEWPGLKADVAQFLLKLAEVTTSRPTGSWDRVFVDIRTAAGLLVGFPSKRGDHILSPDTWVSLLIPFVEELADTAMTAEGLNAAADASAGSELHRLTARLGLAVSAGKRGRQVSRAYRELRKVTDHTVWEMYHSDIETKHELYIP